MYEDGLKMGNCGMCKNLSRKQSERSGVCKVFEKFRLVDDMCESIDKFEPGELATCENCEDLCHGQCSCRQSEFHGLMVLDTHYCPEFVMGYEILGDGE